MTLFGFIVIDLVVKPLMVPSSYVQDSNCTIFIPSLSGLGPFSKSSTILASPANISHTIHSNAVKIDFNLTAVLKRGWRFQQQLKAIGRFITPEIMGSDCLCAWSYFCRNSPYAWTKKVSFSGTSTTSSELDFKDIDSDKNDLQLCSLYAPEIYNNLRVAERQEQRSKSIQKQEEWRLWRELLKESTGIGWCPSKKTVDATKEWWAEKIQENPDFKGFKKKGIQPRLNDLMWQMFGGIVAIGENAWAPSSGVLPSGVPMGDDTPNEGFGDSDENSNENEGIPPNEVPSNPSHKTPNRRKETLEVVHDKGKKSSSSRKLSRNSLATHIEKLCESMASPRKSVNEIIFPHSQYTISNAMDALRDLGDEIPKKDELYYFTIKISKYR
ncbi:hypothetical protein J1N35_005930 [Gossypium stocksii]|uniref:Myb/SANT-like domain-containing protein n=1 Tax=Gossypium stocksii TaxID=47602 RepID=A0A9D3WG90_9ROSI|nr:hypothetical protein J1N35_005930 [Gossypium stocksii]